MPTPIPPRILVPINTGKFDGTDDKSAHRKKQRAEMIKIGLRPKRSLKTPEMAAPRMHPASAELTNQPTSSLFSKNAFSTNSTVPEMVTVQVWRRPPVQCLENASQIVVQFFP